MEANYVFSENIHNNDNLSVILSEFKYQCICSEINKNFVV